MDWPCAEAFFTDNHFDNFQYDSRSFKIIRKLQSDQELVCCDVNSPEDLKQWIKENKPLICREHEPGTFIIIFSRSHDLDVSSPSYLPVSIGDFAELIKLFQIHQTIVRAIRRGVTHFSRMHLDTKGHDGSKIVYAARMSSIWPDDIAMSSTFISRRRLSLSVFYGCNGDQLSKIEKCLNKAGDAVYHPMLASGMFAELERDRLVGKVNRVLDPYVLSTESLSCTTRDPQSILNRDGENPDELSYLYHCTAELIKGIQRLQQQNSDMVKHTYELEMTHIAAWRKSKSRKRLGLRNKPNATLGINLEYSNIGIKFRERLSELKAEYDEKLEECEMALKDLKFTTRMASDLVARNQNLEMRKENAQMRSIALVTMVYLPLTSVASIFSMGVFNWNPTADQNVLSFYFWVYIAIAGGFTILTVGLWWVLTRTRQTKNDSTTDVV
ncbi:hypothetical protein F5Y04DRAFT_285913 [Hypomontagnella monticulosa]|nr:hypothetical protein F5Y04DRAFT_285913 [Hypomontagnella monticulosa]